MSINSISYSEESSIPLFLEKIEKDSDETASATSYLDNRISLSTETWAVTMICAKGTNHAQLILEGVNKTNKTFMVLAELNGRDGQSHCRNLGCMEYGKVQYKAMKPRNKLKYDGKTETWARPRSLMIRLIEKIEREITQPNEYPVPFFLLGKKSIFASQVVHVKGKGPQKGSYAMLYTLLASLMIAGAFYHFDVKIVMGRDGVERFFKSFTDLIEVQKESIKNVFLGSLEKTPELLQQSMESIQHGPPTPIIRDLGKESWIFVALFAGGAALESQNRQPEVIKQLMIQQHGEDNVKSLSSDSCCTWSTDGLKLIDVNLPESDEQILATLTRRYTNPDEAPIKISFVSKVYNYFSKGPENNANLPTSLKKQTTSSTSEKRTFSQAIREESFGFIQYAGATLLDIWKKVRSKP